MLAVLGVGGVRATLFDVRALGNIPQEAVFDLAHTAGDVAVFGHGVAQLVTDHGVLRVGSVSAEEGVYRLVCAAAVEIVGVYDGKWAGDRSTAAEHRVACAPGLFTPVGNAVALGQPVKLLIHILHVEEIFHARADGGLEAVLDLMLYDKVDFLKACSARVEQRKINDGMGEFVADAAIKQLVLAGAAPKTAKVVIFGLTFKENCPDIRNSKVEDIIKRLREYGITPMVIDPWAESDAAYEEYNVELSETDAIHDADCIILAVAHAEFREIALEEYSRFFGDKPNEKKVLIDVKGILPYEDVKASGMRYWRL